MNINAILKFLIKINKIKMTKISRFEIATVILTLMLLFLNVKLAPTTSEAWEDWNWLWY